MLALLLLYAGTFSYWWLRSPVTTFNYRGRSVRVVQFHYNRVIWHSGPLWLPAFWFVEHACGYERGGFVALEENSVLEFLK